MIPDIRIEEFNYDLPDSRIAKYPLSERDSSYLLHYDEEGNISRHIFREIPDLLPENSLMIFNDTKVVPARLHFVRDTGARIEIFCLEPTDPSEYNLSFAATSGCEWKCVIGNARKWKNDTLSLYLPENAPAEASALCLKAEPVSRDGQTGVVRFRWEGGVPFSRVLEICGTIPIPPYLNRESETIDIERYQTLYARFRGSVAAPTAGLHFTENVLSAIRGRGIDTDTVCLHVGAGTFLPVKESEIARHPMHREPFAVSIDLLRKLRDGGRKVIAVGTTSVRTLESLFYAGVSCIENGHPHDVEQWSPYDREYSHSTEEAIDALIQYLESHGLDELKTGTRIIIVPGFRFRFTDYLVTNFHQPESTLILLVSAFLGGDWRRVYDYALANDFRFLSYGDSSLLARAGRFGK